MPAAQTGMERDLSVGGVFGTALSALRARAWLLVPLAFVGSLLLSAITALLGEDAIGVVVGFIADMAYFAIVTAVAVAVLLDLREDRPTSSARDLLARALPPLPAATLAALLAFAGFCGAALLLVVPGLYLATIWAVLLPVVVVERPGVFEAFGRSRQLVHGDGWKVFAVLLLLGLILVVTIAPVVLLNSQVDLDVASRLIGHLVSSFTTPYTALVVGALYFRLLDLKRGRPAESVLEQPGDSPG
ncbi:MAG TPA: hypothetical protein VFU11_11880 [Solirubrobacterales bacterium]|nr:hypothetical protein [Solirubrobacterales bacterium]